MVTDTVPDFDTCMQANCTHNSDVTALAPTPSRVPLHQHLMVQDAGNDNDTVEPTHLVSRSLLYTPPPLFFFFYFAFPPSLLLAPTLHL
jgi:hypothetical protein